MFPNIDPSKLDPKKLAKIAELMRELPPDQLYRMQMLSHNMAAGFDVRNEMEQLEKALPPGFREKMLSIMIESEEVSSQTEPGGDAMSMREARLTVLRGVAAGKLSAEEAEKLLFGAENG